MGHERPGVKLGHKYPHPPLQVLLQNTTSPGQRGVLRIHLTIHLSPWVLLMGSLRSPPGVPTEKGLGLRSVSLRAAQATPTR